MKQLYVPALAGLTLAACVQAVELKTDDQKASYGIGVNIGSQLANEQSIEVDIDALIEGLKDSIAGSDLDLSEEEIRAAFGAIQQKAQAKAEEDAKAAQAEAVDFLTANAKKDGVIELVPGKLQYSVITAGEGEAKPTAADTVKTHYHGTLIDGTVFDSSVDRGQPISFPLNGVIPGWTQALQEMTTGDKWKLFIHPDLAYGARGSGAIPPNSALIFEVELLEINPAE